MKHTIYWAKELKNKQIGIWLSPTKTGFMAARLNKDAFRKWVQEKRKLGIGVELMQR